MKFPERRIFRGRTAGLLLLAWALTSCRTLPVPPPVNLSEPGWKLHHGQAVWRRKRGAPEIAGEIFFAAHAGGRTLLELSKNPLPFVTVQTSGDAWQIEFVPERRHFSGLGTPTPRLLWVHFARALDGTSPPPPLKFERPAPLEFTLENLDTGESITGFLNE